MDGIDPTGGRCAMHSTQRMKERLNDREAAIKGRRGNGESTRDMSPINGYVES